MGRKLAKKTHKGAWRKADIADVEDALQDDRLVKKLKQQDSAGKGDIDAELFTVDTAGSGEGLTRASRRELARKHLFPPKDPRLPLSASEELNVNKAIFASKFPSKKAPDSSSAFDLWAAPTAADVAKKKQEAMFPMIKRVAEKRPMKPPATSAKDKSAPAVLPAHEGQSMNPQSSSFEELACLAAAQQLEAEEEAAAVDRNFKPMSAELSKAAGPDAVKGMDDEAKVAAFRRIACPTAVAAELAGIDGDDDTPEKKEQKDRKKAQSKRNRERQRKVQSGLEKQAKEQKRLERSVGEVGALLKDMKRKSAWCEQRRQYREEMKRKREEQYANDGVVPKTRRLGAHRYKEDALEVPDAEAAAGGLRSMPLQAATAVRDRMGSIFRRGLLPAPPQSSKDVSHRMKQQRRLIRKKQKKISPLLKDNLLLK